MERGETLDIIVEKSKKLNFESNSFIKKVNAPHLFDLFRLQK